MREKIDSPLTYTRALWVSTTKILKGGVCSPEKEELILP